MCKHSGRTAADRFQCTPVDPRLPALAYRECSSLECVLCWPWSCFADLFPILHELLVNLAQLVIDAVLCVWGGWCCVWMWKLVIGQGAQHSNTYASPRVLSFPVASSSDGGGALSFFVPNMRFIGDVVGVDDVGLLGEKGGFIVQQLLHELYYRQYYTSTCVGHYCKIVRKSTVGGVCKLDLLAIIVVVQQWLAQARLCLPRCNVGLDCGLQLGIQCWTIANQEQKLKPHKQRRQYQRLWGRQS